MLQQQTGMHKIEVGNLDLLSLWDEQPCKPLMHLSFASCLNIELIYGFKLQSGTTCN
jgi:hypothetical protein